MFLIVKTKKITTAKYVDIIDQDFVTNMVYSNFWWVYLYF